VFSDEHLLKITPGIELFNQQKYWECHEVLEDLWAEDSHDPVRYVYWAIIQVAATCIHFRDKNLLGAQGLHKKSLEKFKKIRELGIMSELLIDKLEWLQLEHLVQKIPLSDVSKLSDFEQLFKFRFSHFPILNET
jgi:uncharacterized protein